MKKLFYNFLTVVGDTCGKSNYNSREKAAFKGLSEYEFENSFQCFALNTENAFRKFSNKFNRQPKFCICIDFRSTIRQTINH